MNSKTQTSKLFLHKALASLPADESLLGARAQIKLALEHIESVEKKRLNRHKNQNEEAEKQTVSQQWYQSLQSGAASGTMFPAQAQQALKNIQSMIKAEEQKIKKLKEKPIVDADGTTLTD